MVNSKTSIQDSITNIETLTRGGQRREAIGLLLELRQNFKIPRGQLSKVAELARRNGLYLLSLRILKPLIYPQKVLDQGPTDIEKVTYAAALVFLGATGEAKQILKGVDKTKEPRALLYLSFAAIHEWDYRAAAIFLKNYLQVPSLTDYEKLVAMVNLLSCCTALDDKISGEAYFLKIRQITEAFGYKLLLGNALALYAQFAINRKQYTEASKFLEQAEENLGSNISIYLLLVKKWQLFIKIQTGQGLQSTTLLQLQALKEKSAQNRYWELVRDIDLFVSVTTANQELFNRVYLGTSFKPFRDKAIRLLPKAIVVPLSGWVVHTVVGKQNEFIDLNFLLRKKNSAQWLSLFKQDLYKPVSLGKAYEFLYQKDHFDADISPKRLLNSVYRFNKLMQSSGIALRIIIRKAEFLLQYTGTEKSYLFLNSRNSRSVSLPVKVDLKYLRKAFAGKSFTAVEAAQVLKISRRGVLGLLLYAEKNGQLSRYGVGPIVRYRFQRTKAVLVSVA